MTELAAIEAAMAARDFSRAADLARAALRQPPQPASTYRLGAEALLALGRAPEALVLLRRGLASAPGDATLLTALCDVHLAQNRPAEAAAAARAAVAADAESAQAWYRLAESQVLLADDPSARAAYERATAIDPSLLKAWVGLANLLTRLGEAEASCEAALRALALDPGDPLAEFAMAAAEVARRDFTGAAARLETLVGRKGALDPMMQATAHSLHGDALHGLGRADEAFAAWTRANQLFRAIYAPAFEANAAQSAAWLERLRLDFEAMPPAAWAPRGEPSHPGPAAAHVFLLGFHRSGTTLLEQVLAAHPAVTSLEEQPTLIDSQVFLDSAAGLIDLSRLDAARAAAHRDAYWARVRGYGAAPEARVFIDKMPLNSLNLPLIATLFPEAKVLFALRDPRDVVLSAFRQRFSPNAATFDMLTLEGTAALYDAVMGWAELCRARLPLNLRDMRYERLVQDFEGEARAVCAWLGLDWNPAVADFAGRARGKAIATPSAAQVRRGVYRGGEGQWRAHRQAMAPVLPRLAPWVSRFGYPEG